MRGGYRLPAGILAPKTDINGTSGKHADDSSGCSGRKCMYIHGIVIDPSSRFSGGLAILTKCATLFLATHRVKSRYFAVTRRAYSSLN
ncbi:hypothetical protein KCP69_04330 [Salmonella enterica subsp. enterica]|nr:hypothetical protein KCP69_04330 [Salmonella enterica subsp. enterica]